LGAKPSGGHGLERGARGNNKISSAKPENVLCPCGEPHKAQGDASVALQTCFNLTGEVQGKRTDK